MRKKQLLERKLALLNEEHAQIERLTAAEQGLAGEEQTAYDSRRAELATIETELASIQKREDAAKANAAQLGNRQAAQAHDRKQDEPYRNFGEQLQDARTFALTGQKSPRQRGIEELAPQGAAEAVPSDGGLLVQTDFATSIRERAVAAAELLPRVVQQPIGPNSNGYKELVLDESSRADGYRGGGMNIYWIGEAGTPTASRPKLRSLSMDLQKAAGLAYITDELMQDAPALAAFTERQFVKEFAYVMDNMIFRGAGVGQPLGFMNAPCLRTISKEAGQAADTIVTENIAKMYAAMPASSIRNSVWLMNQNCLPQLLTLSIALGSNSQPVYLPPGGFSQAPYGTIFGRPVLQIEQAASIGDLGDLTFIDPKEYLWIEKGGLQIASSMHVAFVTDEMAFRFIVRVNGQPYWNVALTPAKGTASSISPFVALAAR